MVNVYALAALYKNKNEFLFLKRHSVNFGADQYSLPGGKVEQGETALQAVKREVWEELGLNIPAESFTLVHTLHRKGTETEFVALCFAAPLGSNEKPQIKEPHKHNDLQFFDLSRDNRTHHPLVPAHEQIIQCVIRNIPYSEHGWNK